MDEDMKEMVWESEHKYKAQFKDPAQNSFCIPSYEFTPVSQKRFERPTVKALHNPPFHSDTSKCERRVMYVNNTKSTLSAEFLKVKQNGNGPVIPAQFAFPQKQRPVKTTHVETRKLGEASNSTVGKPNHSFSSAFEKSFPIKNTVCSTQWNASSRRSPKKMQRRHLSTVEETVREEEREIYRQLLQAVTGRSFFASNTTLFLSPQVSRCMSSSSVSGPLATSSRSSLEPSALDIEPPCQTYFSLDTLHQASTPLLSDATNFKPACENKDFSRHQLNRQHSHPSQEQSKDLDSDSVFIVDSVLEDDHHASTCRLQPDIWIRDLANLYDSRARERRRKIEEQKAITISLQKERLQVCPVKDYINLNLRVPLEKEIPVTLPPKREDEEGQEFPDLTQDMEKEVKRALFGGSQDQVISEGFRLTIIRKDIMTLNSLNWLNDEIINFYMNLLMERSKRKGLPKVHAFNTFFFPKIKSAGYQAVKRWTKKVDVFAADILLVPVHLGVHWCLAVVDFRKKTVTYYDSMGGQNNEACKLLLQYLKLESQDKKGVCFDTNGWSLSSKRSQEIPQQMNGSDCGMFACKYADYITKDKRITFTQHHMPYFRKRMVWEILHQKLL